ncbi:hypothetical protein [Vibrio parahaemolyticus]|uniref:hypothetical protein n=2 Tax=Vibrio parahaemolyticus TaxID=670 RepID=UPI00111EE589|nr:hypothetical protein [Vibrio parahaemolyticus]MDW1972548.1 hypothetical protein [Vibrio sp. 945]MDF5635939.1 hypothetical protein [Vibrio parahaemolyticus]TOB45028.1 hypothetical protein CGK06_11245 [Vibrio parahaemolyticus]HAV1574374.1 hypothetical protein [Vibrio parahaemolyticus]HAV1982718.1 hypothetical protein [Vibrio parahaemolyticus]
MASIINDLKRIQRVTSVVTRATERCFYNAEVSRVTCEYSGSEFTLKLSATVLEHYDLDADICCVSADKCASMFIESILNSVERIIRRLEKEEEEFRSDVKEYGEAFSESPAAYLSSALMFKQIVSGIKP